jgi:uncharacterized protein (TIGR02466 family)
MASDIIPLFSTPLYKGKVEIENSIDENFLKSFSYLSYPDKTGWCSQDQKILLNSGFQSLKKQIDEHINTYLFEVLKISQGKPKHTQSWINKHGPMGYSPKHYHTNSVVSGGVYLECHPNCGEIVFKQSHTHPSWSVNTIRPALSELTIFNADNWAFDVQRGDIFIFPSHLLHEVEKNMSGKDRYMIAFNYFLDGTFGGATGEISIKVS